MTNQETELPTADRPQGRSDADHFHIQFLTNELRKLEQATPTIQLKGFTVIKDSDASIWIASDDGGGEGMELRIDDKFYKEHM